MCVQQCCHLLLFSAFQASHNNLNSGFLLNLAAANESLPTTN